ncbi:MAG: hypothetical protein MI867_25410 [Pseudomonadales bacterium]|nr:hypothetical protein [Pseudomonadales bacterium]
MVFSKVTRTLVGRWRARGIRLLHYLDDFLFAVAPDADGGHCEFDRVQWHVLDDFTAAGFTLNPQKLQLDPSPTIEFLGFSIDTVAGRIGASRVRAEETMDAIRRLWARRKRAPFQLLATLAGKLVSLRPALGHAARIFTRAMYQQLMVVPAHRWRSWYGPLCEPVVEEVQFWDRHFGRMDGQPIWPADAVEESFVYSDASDSGWGGVFRRSPFSAEIAQGYFVPAERRQSSTWRELIAAEHALQSFEGFLRGKAVTLYTDNQNMEWIWQRGSRKPLLNQVVTRVFLWARRFEVSLRIVWIPRDLNTAADDVSKWRDEEDWMLNPREFARLDRQWGPHTCDRFASHTNHLTPRFNSRFWCPGTAGVNAFAFDWGRENNWLNPPFSLIPKVLRHMRACAASGTLIVPRWVSRPWWPLLQPAPGRWAPFVTAVTPLPRSPDLFLPGPLGGNTVAMAAPRWEVLALRVVFSHSPPTGR